MLAAMSGPGLRQSQNKVEVVRKKGGTEEVQRKGKRSYPCAQLLSLGASEGGGAERDMMSPHSES